MACGHPFLFLVLLSFSAQSQEVNNRVLNKAFEESLHFRTKSSSLLLQIAKDDSSGFKLYVRDYNEILQVLLNEDVDNWRTIEQRSEERLKKLNNAQHIPEAYKNYYSSEIELHQSLLNLFFDNKLAGLLKLKSAYKKTKGNREKYPGFEPSIKTEAYLDLILGSAPNNIRWFLKKFGLKGDFESGMKSVRRISQSNNIYQHEAQLIDIVASSYVLSNFQYSRKEINRFLTNNPKSLSGHVVSVLISLKEKDNDKTLEALNSIPTGKPYLDVPIIDFLKGEANIQQGNYNKAALHYYKFVLTHKGVNLIKTTFYRLFQCNMLLGNEQRAMIYLRKVQSGGQELLENDKYAQKFSEAEKIPDVRLIKARLLTDGGYLSKTKEILNSIDTTDFTNASDQVEYCYRYARVFHLEKDLSKAIAFYEKTIELQTWKDDYMAANSCLQLGYIYLHLGDKEKSKSYFRQAQSYHNHAYEESISRKARSGIHNLK